MAGHAAVAEGVSQGVPHSFADRLVRLPPPPVANASAHGGGARGFFVRTADPR